METSTSARNESYTVALAKFIQAKTYVLDDPCWIQFLQDYREEIIRNSTTVDLTESYMLRYRYRILDFLKQQLIANPGLEQAFRIINRIDNDQAFTLDTKKVYVPNVAYLATIYRDFRTRKANLIRKECNEFNEFLLGSS